MWINHRLRAHWSILFQRMSGLNELRCNISHRSFASANRFSAKFHLLLLI